MTIQDLPHLNAALNALSAVLLVIAWFHIKARRIERLEVVGLKTATSHDFG